MATPLPYRLFMTILRLKGDRQSVGESRGDAVIMRLYIIGIIALFPHLCNNSTAFSFVIPEFTPFAFAVDFVNFEMGIFREVELKSLIPQPPRCHDRTHLVFHWVPPV